MQRSKKSQVYSLEAQLGLQTCQMSVIKRTPLCVQGNWQQRTFPKTGKGEIFHVNLYENNLELVNLNSSILKINRRPTNHRTAFKSDFDP